MVGLCVVVAFIASPRGEFEAMLSGLGEAGTNE